MRPLDARDSPAFHTPPRSSPDPAPASDVLDAFAIAPVQEVRVDIRGAGRRRDPLVAELRVPLIAHFEGQRKRFAAVARVGARRGVLHREGWKSQLLPIRRYG